MGVDNTTMFWLLLQSECLHSVKAFTISDAAPPASRLGAHEKLGGGTATTADPNCPKAYSIPYDAVLGKKSWGKEGGRGDVWSYGGCLPKSPLRMMQPRFPANG